VAGGAEALFLKPRLPNGEAFAVTSTTLDTRVRSFEFDYEASPRLWLGVENCDGLGARVGYFYLDADATESALIELGRNDLGSRNISEDVFFAGVGATGTVDDGIAVGTDLKLQTLDIEATQRIVRNCTTFNFAGGVRWATTESRLLATTFDNLGVIDDDYGVRADFDGWGATFAAGLNRQLGCSGLSLLANTRGSALMGKSDVDVLDPIGGNFTFDDDRYSGMFIGEVQVGVKYCRLLSCGAEVSLRGTYEGQYWTGMSLATRMGENFTDSDQLFLDGFGVGLGLNY
jgi:hypothetical protein